jgi:hypothetical protein
MPTFGFPDFSNILPNPYRPIGQAGQYSPDGTSGGFASVKVSSVDSLMSSTTDSGRKTTTPASYHKWNIDIAYNPMTREDFQSIYTFLTFRKTIMKPFYVAIPVSNYQFNLDTVIVHDTPKGWPYTIVSNTVSGGTKPPQIFSIGLKTKIYMVTRAETNTNYMEGYPQPGVGEERYHITPSLSEEAVSGEALEFDNPYYYVQQVGDVAEYSLGDKNLYSFSLKLEEIVQ